LFSHCSSSLVLSNPPLVLAAPRRWPPHLHPQKAKVHHPDAVGADATPGGQRRHVAWNQILAAYDVLKDARCREMYDVSRAERTPGVLRRAAAAGVDAG
jgi:hypothetical protein